MLDIVFWRYGALLLFCGCAGASATTNAPLPTSRPDAPRSASGDMEALAKREGMKLETFDLNKDKHPDVFKFYAPGKDPKTSEQTPLRLARKDVDINHDGKVDMTEFYDNDGRLSHARADLDFDGEIDCTTFYRDGKVTRREFLLGANKGRPGLVKFYAKNMLVRLEADRNGDGKIDHWEHYENGKLDRIGIDTTLDGKADSWQQRQQLAQSSPDVGQFIKEPALYDAAPAGSPTPPPPVTAKQPESDGALPPLPAMTEDKPSRTKAKASPAKKRKVKVKKRITKKRRGDGLPGLPALEELPPLPPAP